MKFLLSDLNLSVKWNTLTKLYKTRDSYLVVLGICLLTILIGFSSPKGFEILHFNPDAPGRLINNLFTAFITVPAIVLAIAAILFAVLQVSNKKISITQLVFQNIYVIPLIYWALLNIILLIAAQLLMDSVSGYFIVRLLLILSYNLILLFAGLIFTFYRLFRYLNYPNIIDDYLLQVSTMVNKEQTPAFSKMDELLLRQWSKEVYAEMLDCVTKEDAILLLKYLNIFEQTLDKNPTSFFVRDFTHNLSKWIIYSYESRSSLSHDVIEFWRTRLTLQVDGGLTVNLFGAERVPLLAYKLTGDIELRSRLVQEFSIRLKEIAEKKFYVSQINEQIKEDADFSKLIFNFLEFSELIKWLILKRDLYNLKIVLNDVRMMRETFIQSDFRGVKELTMANRARGSRDDQDIEEASYQRYLKIAGVIRDIEMINIGNLYWFYFELFKSSRVIVTTDILDVIHLCEQQLDFDDILDILIYLYNQEDNRLLWEDWIWQGEERLDGEAYSLPGIGNVIAAGFAITLIKHPDFQLNLFPTDQHEQFKFLLSRTRDYLNQVLQNPENWVNFFNYDRDGLVNCINTIFAAMDAVDNRIENNFIARLAATPISIEKVESFRQIMQEQWESTRDLMKAFEGLNATEVNPVDKLIDAGENISLTRGKVMFVDGELYSFIYGIEWGKKLNRTVESRFAQKIKHLAALVGDVSLPDVFDLGTAALKEDEFTANAIFIDFALFYTNERALSATGKFKSTQVVANPYPFNIAGVFADALPIITVKDLSFRDLIMLTEMPKGVVMQLRQRDDYYRQNLIIDISEVSAEKANALIVERRENGSPPLSQTELMASMHIHVHQIFDFKIMEPKAIRVYKSSLKNYGR